MKRIAVPRGSHLYLNGSYYEKPLWMTNFQLIGCELVNEKMVGGTQVVLKEKW